MWLLTARRMRRGSRRRSTRLIQSTIALNTVMLAIWPLTGRDSMSGAPRNAAISLANSSSTQAMKSVPW